LLFAFVERQARSVAVVRSMFRLLDHPFPVLGICLLLFWISAWTGASIHGLRKNLTEDSRKDLTFVLGAALTLLGLIIGFTFSMALNQYDQRKAYELEEANTIGTEYSRADLLPAEQAAKVRVLLQQYLDQRLLFYESRNDEQVKQVEARSARLQSAMWSAVAAGAPERPTAILSLAIAGMNNVIDSQGYAQGVWRMRIPVAAWILLIAISILCNFLIGYAARQKSAAQLIVLPLALSISLFLIADIDSPRGGIIRSYPQNLESVSQSLHSE